MEAITIFLSIVGIFFIIIIVKAFFRKEKVLEKWTINEKEDKNTPRCFYGERGFKKTPCLPSKEEVYSYIDSLRGNK